MKPNINQETGIPFGIIALGNLDGDIAHDLFFGPQAENISDQNYLDECFEAGIEPDEDWYCDEPYVEGEYQGVKYGISWLGGAPLLWIYKSDYITDSAAMCSPCCPNAGDLDNEGEYTCYTIPDDWRRDCD